MALGPLLIGLFGVVNWALARRTDQEDARDASDPTQSLATLAEQNATRSALDEAFSETSADGGSAYGTASQLAALSQYAQGASSPASSSTATSVAVETPAASSPAASSSTPTSNANAITTNTTSAEVPSTWVRVDATPVDATAAPSAEDTASAATAARELHAYVMRTSSSQRDRTRIRTLQAAMGGVAVDGLIGRETARRILALTGLRIPGLT